MPDERSARHRRGPHWVTDDLAIGPAPTSREASRLHSAGVGALVDLRVSEERDRDPLDVHGLDTYALPIPDEGVPSRLELEEASDWVLRRMAEGVKIWIVCREGRGRSVFVACAVLLALGHPLDRAYQLVIRVQPRVRLSEQQTRTLIQLAATGVG